MFRCKKLCVVLFWYGTQLLPCQSALTEAESNPGFNKTIGIIHADISKDIIPEPPASLAPRDHDLSIALGVVPALGLLLLCCIVGGAWYHTSYRKVLKDWTNNGRHDDPSKDQLGCSVGADGRAIWNDYYGPYDAENAVDMINIFAICHHRIRDTGIGKRRLPLYAIKGRELESIQNAFSHLEVENRPQFSFEEDVTKPTPGFVRRIWSRLDRNHPSERENLRKQTTAQVNRKSAETSEKYVEVEPTGNTAEDCDINTSAYSYCSECKDIPLRKVYGQTCLRDQAELSQSADDLEVMAVVKSPLSPNSRGDVNEEEKSSEAELELDGKVKLPVQEDPGSAREATLATTPTVLPYHHEDKTKEIYQQVR